MPPFLIFLTYTKYSMSTLGSDQGAKVYVEKLERTRPSWREQVHQRRSASTEKCSQSRSFVVLRCESTLKSATYLGPLSSFGFFNKQRLIFFPHIFWHFVAAAELSVWSRSVYTVFALRDLKSDGRMTSSRGLTSLYNWTVVTYFHNCWEQKPLHIIVWNWWICNSRKNVASA